MAAGVSAPVEAGMGPSVLGIAASIGAKIRDAAEDAKEQREKAAEKGETPKKGSLFKSALANQFNPIKSKKAKSNWAKQFDWNKETKSDQQVKPPTGEGGGDSKGKLKEFIAGGFTAILKDTGLMVSKLDGVKMMTGENLSEVTRASSTLTVIKESIDTQTELRRKALEEAKFARAEKKSEKISDVAGVSGPTEAEKKGEEGSDGGGDGGGPFDWLLNALGIADIASNIPGVGKFLQKLNPFKKPTVTQGGGGKPPGPRMPGTSPRVTTSGGAPATKPGGNWLQKLLPFGDDAAKGGAKLGAKGAGGLLGRILPGAQTALGIGLAAKSFSEGDAIGGALNLGSALPGPFGWAFLAASLGRDIFAPSSGNKELGQAFSIPGLTPEQTSGMSGLEKGILGMSGPSFTGFSEGGIVPSAVPPSPVSPMAEGGVVDNPTKTTLNPGDSVIPLNRNVGKQMLGNKNQATPGETAVDTVGAMILGVSAGLLGKTESGTVGDQVKQDIRKASKQFGISNLTFTSSIGTGQFGKVNPQKSAKDFMQSLFENLTVMGGGKGKKSGGGGGGGAPTAGSVAEQAKTMEGKTASEAVGFMDEQDKALTKAGVPNAVYGSADVMGDVIDQHWCASFVASILASKGYKPPNSAFADAYRADGSSFAGTPGWGEDVKPADAKPGDVITFDYNGGDNIAEHVAIVTANDGKTITYVGGNQGGGSPKNSKVTEGTIGVGDKTVFKITRPKETLGTSTGGNKDAQQAAQGVAQKLNTPQASSATEAAQPRVTQIAQSGMVGKLAQDGMVGPSWLPWNWNKMIDNQRKNNTGIGAEGRYSNVTDPEMRRMMGLPPLKGYASGGSRSQADMRRSMRSGERARRATAQRQMLGVYKDSSGKWQNYGASSKASELPWWQVWDKKGERNRRTAAANQQAKSLAERLNKQEAAKLKPPSKPAPGRTPASSSGTKPAPRPASSSTAASSTAVAVMPSAAASQTKTASAEGSFGSAIPETKSSAMVFADFLYPDLV
jgi:hypothetical protein